MQSGIKDLQQFECFNMVFFKSDHICERLSLQVDSCHNLDPLHNDLHKILDTQSILIYYSALKVKKITGLSKLSFKLSSAYILPQRSDICLQKVAI